MQKSLSCTGVMTTTAAIEIKDAHEAKRSSRKFVERKRLSLGRDKLGDEIKKLRASVSENEDLLEDEEEVSDKSSFAYTSD